MPNPIPDGYHTITPHLTVKDAAQAIDFYQKAFGAKEITRITCPENNQIMHAEIQIGDSRIMLSDEFPDWGCVGPAHYGGSGVTVHIYVEDADSLFKQAVGAGTEVTMPINDTFWGDRYGKVKDPFGHEWSIATHKEDVPPDQLMERAKKAMAGST